MTQTKYRISDLAKDFAVTSKEIVELLASRDKEETSRKPSTTLNDGELDFIFEHYTQAHDTKDLSGYFALAAQRKPTPKKEEKAPVKEEKAPAKEAPAAKAPAKEAAEKAPAAKAPAAKPAAPAAPKAPAAKAPAAAKPAAPAAKAPAAKAPAKEAAPEAPKKPIKPIKPINPPARQPKADKPKNATPQLAVPQERRTVDTRKPQMLASNKYDERFDDMAQSSNRVHGDGGGLRKQKINQKSRQQYRKPHKKETESERLARIQMERKQKHATIQVGETITVGDLALKLKATSGEVIKKLMMLGVMASVNEEIDFDTAFLVAEEFHTKVEKEVVVTIEERIIDDSEDTDDNLVPRDPVVVVMGHVDHGKTSILDAIRKTSVTAGEAGGITQHIGAYRTQVNGQNITFLDTPGHAAFTAMRARGAQATDIAILVVAADDGIMPQTVEAINHAKAAGVSIIVAINKMDKPEANPERVLQQLTEYELVPEEWGGDVICVPVSAHTGMGMDTLLESVLLVAEVKELKANPDRAAKGTVIEARLDKGRGPIATLLVQNGTLRVGDVLVAGMAVGRVRAMTDENGNKLTEAGPSVPVEIMGLAEVPASGDIFNAVSDEKLARELVEQRKTEAKEEQFSQYQKVTLDNLFDQMHEGDIKELSIIVKADVQGSVEAVTQSLEKISNEEVRVRVIHGAVGAVSESDVMLADASNAIIVGFNVRPDPLAQVAADNAGVEMRMYRVIYDAIEDVETAMKGMLAPKTREVLHGSAEVRQVYRITGIGLVAGCYVTQGKVYRNDLLRIVRDGIIIGDDKMISLKRFKDDQKEVAEGYECGIGLEKFTDIQEGDVYETYVIEEYRD